MKGHAEWRGTSTDLLNTLKTITPEKLQKIKAWPKAPTSLSNRLMRLEDFLSSKCIEISRERQSDKRLIILRKVKDSAVDMANNQPYFLSDRSRKVAEAETMVEDKTGMPDYSGKPAEIQQIEFKAETEYEEGII